MSFLDNAVYQYCEQHSTGPDSVLLELERETHLKTLAPQMMSSHFQGQILFFLAKMIKAQKILEIGTFTGYSAICMARAMKSEGELVTIEANPELESTIRKFVSKADLIDQVTLIIDDAEKALTYIKGPFDMVFIDAGKRNYIKHYHSVFDKIRSGGLIIADNVLWSGKVINDKKDKDSSEIDKFNKMLHKDERVINLILPIRDGLLIAMKK